jgi:tetratricopeptide (TPR) repeat protein
MLIDAGFFPSYAEQTGFSNLAVMRGFFDPLTLRKIRVLSMVIVSPPEIPAMHGYLADEFASILKDPSLVGASVPPALWSVRDKADNMLTSGSFRDAAAYLEKEMNGYPDDPYLLMMRSTAQALLSQRSRALGAMTDLCAAQPTFCRGIADAGVMLRERGDLAGAEEFLKKTLSLQPGLARARIEYGLTLYRAGKYAAAAAEASGLLTDPAYAVMSGFLLGDCAYAEQREAEAIGWYERALQSYREAGRYRLSSWEQQSAGRLRSLYEKRSDQRSLRALEMETAGQ